MESIKKFLINTLKSRNYGIYRTGYSELSSFIDRSSDYGKDNLYFFAFSNSVRSDFLFFYYFQKQDFELAG